MNDRSRVIVVGNGCIGASISVELQRRGHSVTRLGKQHRPFSATTAAGAMLGSFGEITRHTLRTDFGRLKFESDIRASQLWAPWDQFLIEHSEEQASLYTARGTVVLLNTVGTKAVDNGNYDAMRAALHEYSMKYEEINPDDIVGYSPNPLSRALKGFFIPGEDAVAADVLLTRLDSVLTRLGGQIVDDEAQSILIRSSKCRGVVLSSGAHLEADAVVIAAGVGSLKILDMIPDLKKGIPPLFSGYGVSALIRPEHPVMTDHVIRTPNRAFACGLHSIPRSNGLMYVGGTNVIKEKPRRHAAIRDAQFLLECAVDQLSIELPKASLEAVQVGNRPVPADGFPLIGDLGIDALYMATGTYRDGLHQSPLIAEHVADLVTGQPGRHYDLLGSFRPHRAPLYDLDRSTVIDDTTEELMAAGFETDWTLKPEWFEHIEENARRTYIERAERLDQRFTPPPELLTAMTPSIESQLRSYYQAWA